MPRFIKPDARGGGVLIIRVLPVVGVESRDSPASPCSLVLGSRKEQNKMYKHKKLGWSKPKVVLLVRGKPEEGVLRACKGGGRSGADVNYGGCLRFWNIMGGACNGNCSSSLST